MLADYGSTGVTLREHPLELMRPGLPADLQHERASSRRHPHGRRVRVAGLVIARQRPATAKGVTFMLLEDELGTINLIVPPPVHDRFRLAVRAEPLVLAAGPPRAPRGHDQRAVDRIERLERPDLPLAEVTPHRAAPRVVERRRRAELPCSPPARTASGAAGRQSSDSHGQVASSSAPRAGPTPGFVKEWYPPKLPARERLAWYAERFEYVELNSSFYAIPDRNTVHRWVEVDARTASSSTSRSIARCPVTRRRSTRCRRTCATSSHGAAGTLELEPRWPSGSSRRRRRSPRPASSAPSCCSSRPAFSPGKHKLEELDGLVEALAPHRLAIELRHRGWVRDERREATLDWFADRGVAFVGVDAPPGDHFQIMPSDSTRSRPTTSPTCARTAATPTAT